MPLPESGAGTLGKDRKYADFVLHDLYVARIHCVLHVQGEKMEIADEGSHGLQVNGQKVERQKINVGDVFRIGNSHIRIETVVAGQEVAKVAGGPAEDEEPIEL